MFVIRTLFFFFYSINRSTKSEPTCCQVVTETHRRRQSKCCHPPLRNTSFKSQLNSVNNCNNLHTGMHYSFEIKIDRLVQPTRAGSQYALPILKVNNLLNFNLSNDQFVLLESYTGDSIVKMTQFIYDISCFILLCNRMKSIIS